MYANFKYYVLCILVLFSVNVNAQEAQPSEQALLKKILAASDDTSKVRAFLDMGRYYVNKPGEDKADMNKASSYATQAINESNKIHFYTGEGGGYALLAQIAREGGDRIKGKDLATKAVKYFPPNSSPTQEEALAYIELSNYYSIDIAAELPQKINYYNHAVDILRKVMPNTLKLADDLKFLGDLYNVSDQYHKGISLLLESLAIYKANKYTKLQDIYSLLGDMHVAIANTAEALKYHQLALKSAQENKDSSSVVYLIYNRLGHMYTVLRNYPEAANAYQQAALFAEKIHDIQAAQLLTVNYAWTHFEMHHEQKALEIANNVMKKYAITDTSIYIALQEIAMKVHTSLKEYAEAERIYNKLSTLNIEHYAQRIMLANFNQAAIELFLAIPKLDMARKHIDILQKIFEGKKHFNSVSALEGYRFQLDSITGNYLSAIQHQRLHYLYKDSATEAFHTEQLRQLQVQYETEKKDLEITNKAKNIQSLQHQVGLQQRALKSEMFARNMMFGGIILLILLLALAFSRYRLKQRVNRQLEEKQTAINEQNESLKLLLNEREWLLKEVHHRVKNNLQIVISLLNSQSIYLEDGLALDVIRESQHRMHSISLIHQKLYQGENLSGIDMHDYIIELLTYLQDSFSTRGKIAFRINIARVMLDVSQAVPLGLIINEAITNAIKYAFSERKDGEIDISLTESSDHSLTLSIADNGKGLPAGFDISECDSLGMNLMQGLTRQLSSKLELTNHAGEGLHIVIVMKKINLLGASQELAAAS